MKKNILIILIFLLTVGCSNQNTNVSTKPEKDSQAKELIKKYNGELFNDEFKMFDYTINKQNKDLTKVFIHSANIDDIYKAKENTYIKLSDIESEFILKCKVDLKDKLLKNTSVYDKIYFAMKIDSIKKIDFGLISDEEDNMLINLESSETTIYKGDLIDFIGDKP